MPNTWFTGDFHLGHANIIRYCGRPFPTIEEIDQAILKRLNASVKANDILYFLGDFCIGNQARILECRRRIRGKKIFAAPGNHDKQARKQKEEFSGLDNLAEVPINGQPIVLCSCSGQIQCSRGSLKGDRRLRQAQQCVILGIRFQISRLWPKRDSGRESDIHF